MDRGNVRLRNHAEVYVTQPGMDLRDFVIHTMEELSNFLRSERESEGKDGKKRRRERRGDDFVEGEEKSIEEEKSMEEEDFAEEDDVEMSEEMNREDVSAERIMREISELDKDRMRMEEKDFKKLTTEDKGFLKLSLESGDDLWLVRLISHRIMIWIYRIDEIRRSSSNLQEKMSGDMKKYIKLVYEDVKSILERSGNIPIISRENN